MIKTYDSTLEVYIHIYVQLEQHWTVSPDMSVAQVVLNSLYKSPSKSHFHTSIIIIISIYKYDPIVKLFILIKIEN